MSETEQEHADEGEGVYRIKLEMFEGPLDLLLHLIRKHELDILDIPVSFITEKYLEYLELMQLMQIDVASEYLVMAATLTHLKSKMLLPPDPNQEGEDGELEEEIDPRAELVRRLLEYQKYKHAANQLSRRSTVGRDVFDRGSEEAVPEGPAPLAPVNVFKLFDAFERVLKKADKPTHQVMFERVGLTERIVELTEMLQKRGRMRFEDCFLTDKDGKSTSPSKLELVLTFLALLEMGKMRVARIYQDGPLGRIVVELASNPPTDVPTFAEEDPEEEATDAENAVDPSPGAVEDDGLGLSAVVTRFGPPPRLSGLSVGDLAASSFDAPKLQAPFLGLTTGRTTHRLPVLGMGRAAAPAPEPFEDEPVVPMSGEETPVKDGMLDEPVAADEPMVTLPELPGTALALPTEPLALVELERAPTSHHFALTARAIGAPFRRSQLKTLRRGVASRLARVCAPRAAGLDDEDA